MENEGFVNAGGKAKRFAFSLSFRVHSVPTKIHEKLPVRRKPSVQLERLHIKLYVILFHDNY